MYCENVLKFDSVCKKKRKKISIFFTTRLFLKPLIKNLKVFGSFNSYFGKNTI